MGRTRAYSYHLAQPREPLVCSSAERDWEALSAVRLASPGLREGLRPLLQLVMIVLLLLLSELSGCASELSGQAVPSWS